MKKSVLLLSIMHDCDRMDKETRHQVKPEIIPFYNLIRHEVDVVD